MNRRGTALLWVILLVPGAGQDDARDGFRGRVFVGYQGWFTAEGDGSGRPWTHYSKKGRFEPGRCTIELWPDLSELDEDEKYPTPFRHRDGAVAHVFSSYNPKTVDRHFRWMKEYGIDGAFVQRFAVRLRSPKVAPLWDRILDNCRKGADRNGRTWAVMYDLSGLKRGETALLRKDWRNLVATLKVVEDRTYLRHRGKPVVAVWGVGFRDGREYTLAECGALVDFLKSEEGGGCSVMLGVPSFFRERRRDAVKDPLLHDILAKADVLSPWTVGRYRTPDEAGKHADAEWAPDLRWCRERKLNYLPVVFPGFSWSNMKPPAPLDQIPRRKGAFLWSQFYHARRVGAESVYVAMFDEIDEATAIMKCTNDPPVGASRFLTYEGLPSDHYLWLTGQGRKLFAGSLELRADLPRR